MANLPLLFLSVTSGCNSIFTFMQTSFDCRPWQWYIYLLESVLDLARCFEGVFVIQGKNCAIIHFSCLPQSSRPLELMSYPAHSLFLRMCQIADVATPKGFCSDSLSFSVYLFENPLQGCTESKLQKLCHCPNIYGPVIVLHLKTCFGD